MLAAAAKSELRVPKVERKPVQKKAKSARAQESLPETAQFPLLTVQAVPFARPPGAEVLEVRSKALQRTGVALPPQ